MFGKFTFFDWALFVTMLVTCLILLAGLFVMIKGGPLNEKYGNKLMRWRVMAQGIAIGLFALLILMKGH